MFIILLAYIISIICIFILTYIFEYERIETIGDLFDQIIPFSYIPILNVGVILFLITEILKRKWVLKKTKWLNNFLNIKIKK